LFRCSVPESLSIDYGTLELESGSFIDPELADSHSDLLFSARLHGDPVLLYLLLEHRSTNDRAMPLRAYQYLARIWKRHFQENGLPLPLIIPLVVSHAALSAFQKLALWALRDARDIEELQRNAILWADAASEAQRAPNGLEAVALLFRYVALITDPLNYKRCRANILKRSTKTEEAIMTMTAYEEMVREGQFRALRRQLVIKFGEVPGEYLTKLAEATEQQLERFTARILSAQTIEEVFADPT
jgi:hypothetical protein